MMLRLVRDDRANAGPIVVLAIVVLTLIFEGMLYGSELAEQSFPTLDEPEEEDCSGFLDGFACGVRAAWNFIRMLFGVVAFFYNLVTFNVPGAPWFVRVFVGAIFGGSILWTLAVFIRRG